MSYEDEMAEEENRIAAEKRLEEMMAIMLAAPRKRQRACDMCDDMFDPDVLESIDLCPACSKKWWEEEDDTREDALAELTAQAQPHDTKMELRYICPVCNDGKLYDKAYYEPSGIFVFQCEKCKRLFVEADEMPMIDISEIGDWAELIYERNCDRLETANLLLELVKQSQNPGDYGIPTKCWSDDTITHKCTIGEVSAQPPDAFLISRETLRRWLDVSAMTTEDVFREIKALLNGTAEAE